MIGLLPVLTALGRHRRNAEVAIFLKKGLATGSLDYYGTATALSVGGRYLAGASVGDYALFGGSYTDSSPYSDVVDAYNTSLTRSTPTALGVGRYYLAGASVGNYALFGGGYSGRTEVDAYNTSLTHSTPTALSVGRHYLAGASVGDYALFGGGYSGRTEVDAYSILHLLIQHQQH